MINTKSKLKQEIVSQFAELRATKRELEKRERELRKSLIEMMGDSAVLVAGDYVLTLTTRGRTSLDREALEIAMGAEWLSNYEKTSTYTVLDCKPARVGAGAQRKEEVA